MNRLLVLAVFLFAACAERYYTPESVDAPRSAQCPTPRKARVLALEWHGLVIHSRASFPRDEFKSVDFLITVENKTNQAVHLESDMFLVSVDDGPESPVKITTKLNGKYQIPATFPLTGASLFWSGHVDQKQAEIVRIRVPALLLNGKPTQLPVLTLFKDPPLVC